MRGAALPPTHLRPPPRDGDSGPAVLTGGQPRAFPGTESVRLHVAGSLRPAPSTLTRKPRCHLYCLPHGAAGPCSPGMGPGGGASPRTGRITPTRVAKPKWSSRLPAQNSTNNANNNSNCESNGGVAKSPGTVSTRQTAPCHAALHQPGPWEDRASRARHTSWELSACRVSCFRPEAGPHWRWGDETWGTGCSWGALYGVGGQAAGHSPSPRPRSQGLPGDVFLVNVHILRDGGLICGQSVPGEGQGTQIISDRSVQLQICVPGSGLAAWL